MEFKHIISPTDFSEVSINALIFAAEIAKLEQGQIHLVHVYEKPYEAIANQAGGGLNAEVDVKLNKELRDEINRQIDNVAQLDFLKGITLSKRIISDVPVAKFVEHIDKQEADLIVMGTHGYRGLMHGGLVGTNTERVIRSSPYPVLSVPEGVIFNSFKKILFATDFRDPLDGHFAALTRFAKLFGAEIYVCVINTRQNYATTHFAEEQFARLKQTYPNDKLHFVVYNDEDVENGIANVAQKYSVDLVSLLTHGRTGINRLINGNIAEDLSKYLHTPLLTFRNA